jgi:hypothetical protein
MFPNYENTISVICLDRFEEIKRIEVAINLHRVRADRHGNLWVTSRGDYFTVPSRLFWICLENHEVGGMLDVAVSNFWLDGDSLYIIGTEWSWLTMSNTITYTEKCTQKYKTATKSCSRNRASFNSKFERYHHIGFESANQSNVFYLKCKSCLDRNFQLHRLYVVEI